MAIFVRTASDRDLEAIRSLLADTWHDTYDPIYGRERVTEITQEWHAPAALAAMLTAPGSEFLVADDGEVIAGVAFASTGPDDRVVVLRQLYVRPSMQGRGIGTLLLEEIEGCYPQARLVRLEVEEANGRALAFYGSHGYAGVAKAQDQDATGDAPRIVIMEKAIG